MRLHRSPRGAMQHPAQDCSPLLPQAAQGMGGYSCGGCNNPFLVSRGMLLCGKPLGNQANTGSSTWGGEREDSRREAHAPVATTLAAARHCQTTWPVARADTCNSASHTALTAALTLTARSLCTGGAGEEGPRCQAERLAPTSHTHQDARPLAHACNQAPQGGRLRRPRQRRAGPAGPRCDYTAAAAAGSCCAICSVLPAAPVFSSPSTPAGAWPRLMLGSEQSLEAMHGGHGPCGRQNMWADGPTHRSNG